MIRTGEILKLHVSLHEYEPSKELSLAELLSAAGAGREELVSYFRPLVKMSLSWSPGGVRLLAEGVIGTIRLGHLRVDVRPRLAARELVTLIRYALGATVESCRRSSINDQRGGLDELLCRVLEEELRVIRQIGLSRRYVERNKALPVLRGRPDFLSSFPWNDEGMSEMHCRFHELTCDNLDNQLILAALERATLLETTLSTRHSILEHRQVWSSVASRRDVSREEFKRARERYTRLSEHYELAHKLSEYLIFGQRPGSLYETGAVTTGGLTLDMADLFELFLYRLLSEQLSPLGYRVRVQNPDKGAFLDGGGCTYRRVRPDFVVFKGEKAVAVIDAKYKDYWRADASTGMPNRRVSNEDLYQLFFYAQRLQLRFAMKHMPPAFIFAPLPAADERDGAGIVASQYSEIVWRAGSDAPSRVRLTFVPLTELLRCLLERRNQNQILSGLVEPIIRELA